MGREACGPGSVRAGKRPARGLGHELRPAMAAEGIHKVKVDLWTARYRLTCINAAQLKSIYKTA